ncbi:MAG: type II toxin-antitoxin system VapC family toxin [Pseudomonadota bacterium]
MLDAGVAIKLAVGEDGSEAAAAPLDGRPLHAPAPMGVEAANALGAMARRGLIPAGGAADALDLLLKTPPASTPRDVDPTAEVLRLAAPLDRPVHDCVHLSLAATLRPPVVTADRRFLAAARRTAETAPFVAPPIPDG